jgi:hypothetical protein
LKIVRSTKIYAETALMHPAAVAVTGTARVLAMVEAEEEFTASMIWYYQDARLVKTIVGMEVTRME